jgi:hypothetical protein
MVGSILSLVAGLVSLATRILDWLHERQIIEAGRAQEQLETMKASHAEAQIAIAAREAQRSVNLRQPGRLRDDDGFRRDE